MDIPKIVFACALVPVTFQDAMGVRPNMPDTIETPYTYSRVEWEFNVAVQSGVFVNGPQTACMDFWSQKGLR